MPKEPVVEAMRADWDERAREDAHYYVAFGRRAQSEEEFFGSASDQVRLFETELKRRPAEFWKAAAALEIGCGPGRLLQPLSRLFRAIHGLDISPGMLRRAQANLARVANLTLHHAVDSNLSGFGDASIDFVYSYAVFQHIPSKDIVFGYLREAVRVLTPGGLLVFQINGLPSEGHEPTTWEGCRVSAEELSSFAQDNGMLLLSLTDKGTQYMWVTLQKPWPFPPARPDRTAVFSVTNAFTGEPAVPAGGRFGAASVWMTDLPDETDLLSLSARVDGAPAYCCYISPPTNGRRFLDLMLPAGTRTGLVAIDLAWRGAPLGNPAWARVIPPGPKIPSLAYVADGINLLSLNRIESGSVKMVMDEIRDPASVSIRLDGADVPFNWFCIHPVHERYEFNFRTTGLVTPGSYSIDLKVGGKQFAPIPIEII